MIPFSNLERNDVFARMAFFTGCPHATVAVATTKASIWLIPKRDFETPIQHTPPHIAEKLHKLLKGDVSEEFREMVNRDDPALLGQ